MSSRFRRRDVIRGIGAAGALGLAGCTGDDGNGDGDGDTPTPTPDDSGTPMDGGDGGREIMLGLLMGVTGSLEQLGPPIRNAATLVPQQINDADTDFSVQTQFEDTGTSPSQGVSGAEALVNAGFPMVCGALSSEVTEQVASNVLIPSETTMCSPASTSPAITDLEDDGYVFRTPPTDALQGAVQAQIAAERLGHDTAATLYLNNSYGSGLSGGFADSFENDYDGTVTATVSFSEGQNSYTSQLEQALADDPDILIIVGYPDEGVQIFRDFYSNFDKADMDILVSDGLQDPDLPGDVGFDMTNVRGTAPTGAGPGLDFFNQYYQDEYDAEPGVFTKQAYDAAAVLVLANAAAGENDGTAVRDQMQAVAAEGGTEVTPSNLVEGLEMAAAGEEINYQGVSGPVAFDENGDLASASYLYFQFTQDGLEEIESVTP